MQSETRKRARAILDCLKCICGSSIPKRSDQLSFVITPDEDTPVCGVQCARSINGPKITVRFADIRSNLEELSQLVENEATTVHTCKLIIQIS